MNAPDLTQRPPRSPRVRLGGYTILPRLLDKARAVIAGTAGEYKYNNPNDGHFFRFTGLTPEALLARMRLDKKAQASGLRFILWNGPGAAQIVADVEEGAALAALRTEA